MQLSQFSYRPPTCGGLGYSQLYKSTPVYPAATYDTWSTHYEQNGYDEDQNGVADTGMDGLDDASASLAVNGIVDDAPVGGQNAVG